MYDDNNIFAKIIRKEIPSKIVYEDDKVIFFNDINPASKIHVLGVPKMNVVDFSDFIYKADKEMISYFFLKINDVIKELNLHKNGFKLITNSGENGGQEVPHFHIHILGGEKL
jgi:diadenosine tetraphosphate (Ap4A) HIT family hydrolase